MNLLIYFCILIIIELTIYFMFKLLNTQGLSIALLLVNITSFILSFKLIKISTISFISNSITYISLFTIIYLFIEKKYTKDVKKIININFLINIFIAIMLYLMSYYTQSIDDTIGINMTNVFIKNYRILIAYPITTFISSHLTVMMYNKIKNLYENIFISTTTTYLAIGLIDIIIYTLLCYFNIYQTKILIKISLSTYMIRLIITVIYSLYLTKITSSKKVKK